MPHNHEGEPKQKTFLRLITIISLFIVSHLATDSGTAHAADQDWPGKGNARSSESAYLPPENLAEFLTAIFQSERVTSISDTVNDMHATWETYQNYLWASMHDDDGEVLSVENQIIIAALRKQIEEDSSFLITLLRIASPTDYDKICRVLGQIPEVSTNSSDLQGIEADIATYVLETHFGADDLANYLHEVFANSTEENSKTRVAQILATMMRNRYSQPQPYYGLGLGGSQTHPDAWTLDGRLQVPNRVYLLAGTNRIHGTATSSDGTVTTGFIELIRPGYYEIETEMDDNDQPIIWLIGRNESFKISPLSQS